MTPTETRWWETRWFVALLILLSALPLLRPAIPPLLDLPGHMASYAAELDYARSPDLQRFYSFQWSLIGNLGVNLLVLPFAKLIGLEPAVKLVMILILPLTAAGFLWVAQEVHGRIPPTAVFALPLACNFPFIFGFVNFCLSMALAMLALGLWLRLGRQDRLGLRAALFVPISFGLWLTHVYGWAALCVTAFSAEYFRMHDRGLKPAAAVWAAGLRCLPLAIAVIPLIVWRTGDVGGETKGWNPFDKISYASKALRDRWIWLDLPSALLLYGMVVFAWRSPRLDFSRNLAGSAIILLIVYFLLPSRIFGSSYADMRILPFLLALALLAIRPRPEASWGLRQALALGAFAFFLFRVAVNTASFWLYDQSYRQELAALDHVPRGARVVSLVGTPCRNTWKMDRLDHLPGMAVVRRHAFSNDQWSLPGAQLLLSRYQREAGWFAVNPSQIVRIENCSVNRWPTIDESLSRLPPAPFDYLWLIKPPAYDQRLVAGMVPIWRSGASVLYRIPHGARRQ